MANEVRTPLLFAFLLFCLFNLIALSNNNLCDATMLVENMFISHSLALQISIPLFIK